MITISDYFVQFQNALLIEIFMIVTLIIKYCMVTSNFSNLGFYHRLYGGRNLSARKFYKIVQVIKTLYLRLHMYLQNCSKDQIGPMDPRDPRWLG